MMVTIPHQPESDVETCRITPFSSAKMFPSSPLNFDHSPIRFSPSPNCLRILLGTPPDRTLGGSPTKSTVTPAYVLSVVGMLHPSWGSLLMSPPLYAFPFTLCLPQIPVFSTLKFILLSGWSQSSPRLSNGFSAINTGFDYHIIHSRPVTMLHHHLHSQIPSSRVMYCCNQ